MTKSQNIIRIHEVMTPLFLSEKDETILDQFENVLLSDNVYYPFQPVKHINQVFIENINEQLLKDFAFKNKSRKLILDRLISISYSQIKKNWLNLIQICFNTYHYQYHPERLLNKIKEANQM